MTDVSTQTIPLPGLSAEGEIRVDRWGIPHIRASNEADLFFLQGFNAARDRLWQIDLWRKRGLGLLAADFGPGYLAQDHAARHFLYRGDMDAEWRAYADDTREICTAFAAGVNAFIARCEREPERLAAEFALFDTKPLPWEPADVVRIRSHALTRNGVSEILRANVLAMADAEADLMRFEIDPPVEPRFADGITSADVPLECIRLFKLATAPVTFERERLAATLDDVWRWTEVTDLGEVVRRAAEEGSNNWAVHPSRTRSGRPILASDPHRAHAVPSLRYLVHLEAPGLDVIGAGEPSAPGISIGHNASLAFGLTIFGADQEDVCVYETKENDPDLYCYGDGWEAIRRTQERFAVRGHEDQHLTLSFTRHGPVLHEDTGRRRAVALRTVWLLPGSAAYLGSLSYMREATTVAFAASLDHWGTPSVNHVAADTNGDIGWFTAGFTPRRLNWHGLLPVPGDGTHEWDGFLAPEELPHAFNPERGFVSSANEMNLPADRPTDAPTIGHEWADASRARRIESVLERDASHTLEASMALQTDTHSRPAAVLTSLLKGAGTSDGEPSRAIALLSSWNHHLDADSAAAALFEVWWMKHLRPAVLARAAPDPALRKLLLPGDFDRMLSMLEDAAPFWTPLERDALLLATLADAWSECEKRLGSEPSAWCWGTLHRAVFEHEASGVKPRADTTWDVGPLPLGGSRSTPMHAAYRLDDFVVNAGASVRLVMDVGEWDASVCINAPGQSGDSQSLHYADLAPLWSQGAFVPLLYSRARVDEATQQLIRLVPSSGGTAP
ncbi:penicillin acylase family protein [Aureimonas sp. AU20]|uniref:penicillin acylase family protein n=1 Tax=Aureimonas sp. AU20 TaxID=1349819 RepID=UPI000722EBFF|nr:penicillin acylase family protein [Aureimonas sp. AU20]ALN71237.1 hypothetical protein M673_00845 [Aureimonas sp. AU20]